MTPGEVNYRGLTVTDVLRQAYGLMESQVVGPGWLESDRFNIEAKIPAAASQDRIHEVPLMLQTLLADRFRLAFHIEKKTLPMYALVVSDKGPKVQAAAQDDPKEEGCVSAYVPGGPNALQCHVRMADLARNLLEIMQEGVPVVDETGLSGVYDFKLSWVGRVMIAIAHQDGPSIFEAVQQLGLKLAPRKEPVDVMVVEHIERPSGN